MPSDTWSRVWRSRGSSTGRTSRSAVSRIWGSTPAGARSERRGDDAQEAIAIAEAHGWATDPIACLAFATMALVDAAQGRFGNGRDRLDQAERAVRVDLDPATALLLRFARGELLVGEGRLGEALGEFRAAERLQDVLVAAHSLTGPARVSIAQMQLANG